MVIFQGRDHVIIRVDLQKLSNPQFIETDCVRRIFIDETRLRKWKNILTVSIVMWLEKQSR